jgi:membrane protease YdiL (CAAX protease family)
MVMNSTNYKLSELFILFIVFPIIITIDFPIWIKLIMGSLGFFYVTYLLLKVEHMQIKIKTTIKWKSFWISTLLKFLFIVIVTVLYVWLTDKIQLFNVVKSKPLLWVVILFVYSIFSVYPQEIIYRTFFFKRYRSLIRNEYVFIFINALVFSLGHIFFSNFLVMILTFFGGLLFAFTFSKTKSTVLVSIEHAIYGCWLFTVGMGSMLGFPS